jgi:hypothetical protein
MDLLRKRKDSIFCEGSYCKEVEGEHPALETLTRVLEEGGNSPGQPKEKKIFCLSNPLYELLNKRNNFTELLLALNYSKTLVKTKLLTPGDFSLNVFRKL